MWSGSVSQVTGAIHKKIVVPDVVEEERSFVEPCSPICPSVQTWLLLVWVSEFSQ